LRTATTKYKWGILQYQEKKLLEQEKQVVKLEVKSLFDLLHFTMELP
jgi:hypothetical protein